jgi:uncharacterized protein with HEPN domain
MSKRDYRLFINDMYDCACKILDYVKGLSFEEFIKNEMLIDAVIRNLEIIGEASKHLPVGLRRKYPQIEWRKIGDLRNIVIHEYFAIDYDILWDIVQNKVPTLLKEVGKMAEMEISDKNN